MSCTVDRAKPICRAWQRHHGLDWARIFGAAWTGGVKNYFVEVSWVLTLPSVAFLKGLNVWADWALPNS